MQFNRILLYFEGKQWIEIKGWAKYGQDHDGNVTVI